MRNWSVLILFSRPSWAPQNPSESSQPQVDATGKAWVAGNTFSTLDGNEKAGKYDIFLMTFDGDGNHLWTRQRGGARSDYANALQVESGLRVVVVVRHMLRRLHLVHLNARNYGQWQGSVLILCGLSVIGFGHCLQSVGQAMDAICFNVKCQNQCTRVWSCISRLFMAPEQLGRAGTNSGKLPCTCHGRLTRLARLGWLAPPSAHSTGIRTLVVRTSFL